MKLLISNLSAALILLGILAFVTSSCQTVGGAGRDIESAGEALQDASR